MAREVAELPESYRTLGVEYIVDCDDQHVLWSTWTGLRERIAEEPLPKLIEAARALEPKIDDLFTAEIMPVTHDEYADIEASERSKVLEVKVDAKKQSATVKGDPMSIGERVAMRVVAMRVGKVKNYIAVYFELGPDGRPVFEHGKRKIRERKPITTGKELVDFISKHAWDSEREIIDDLFKAIRDRSHLEAGEKKTYEPLPLSSSAITSP